MVVSIAALWLLQLNVLAQVVYVDAAAVGANNGSTWTDAFTNLQDALISGAMEIWVATGTYYPTATADRAATFQLSNSMALYGGFNGTETLLEQRDPILNVTVLSGDLLHDDSAIDWTGHPNNSIHVVTGSNSDSTAVLDGFVVYGGYMGSINFYDQVGNAILIVNGSPTIRNSAIQWNIGIIGGGVYVAGGNPRFENCSFDHNWAWYGRGGAVFVTGSLNSSCVGCTFTDNEAVGVSGEGAGGAVFIDMDAGMRLVKCVFESNESRNFYPQGGMYGSNGGAVYNMGDGLTIVDCVFRRNVAYDGGALYSWGNSTVANTMFTANQAISHNINGGSAGGNGGAAVFISFAAKTSTVTNCEVYGNTATDNGGGLIGWQNHALDVNNSILWRNSDSRGIVFKSQCSGTNPNYCCVESLFVAPPDDDPPAPEDVPGCIFSNPQLVDADGANNYLGDADDNFRLAAASPCIDAGDNTVIPAWLLMDLAGHARRVDDPNTVDTGLGTAPIADMGVYEYYLATPPPAPVVVIQTLDENSVELNWNPIPAANHFDIYLEWGTTDSLIGSTTTGSFLLPSALAVPGVPRQFYVVAVSE